MTDHSPETCDHLAAAALVEPPPIATNGCATCLSISQV